MTTRTNAALYAAGKEYAAAKAALEAGQRAKATWRQVGERCGADGGTARHAAAFAAAVDRVAANCGPGAKRLLLSGHPRLPPEVVLRVSRTHPDRQRYELAQVRAGRPALAEPPAGTVPPFDTLHAGEVLGRLARNAGAIAAAADGLLATPHPDWPDDALLTAVLAHADGVRRHVRAMKTALAGSSPCHPRVGADRPVARRPGTRKPFDPRRTLSAVAAAAGAVGKTCRDLPRVLADTPPTAGERAALVARLRHLDAAAGRLAAVVKAKGHDRRTGPAAVPGTYVVLFRLDRPHPRLRVGRLGTFDFPAGVYAYAGSAFGGGGVRGRTARHLTAGKRERWNLDHLLPLGTPLAVWWTHDRRAVEFAWAAALAALPGASFPARRFGAADNKKAEAHLVRFEGVPPLAAFRKQAARLVPGHAAIAGVAITNWTGRGWPG